MRSRTIIHCTALLLLLGGHVITQPLHAQQLGIWRQTAGPYGGTITALVGTQQGVVIAGTMSGAFRSTDGVNWSRGANAPLLHEVRALALANTGSVYATTPDGLYVTSDAGLNWSRRGPASADLYGIATGANGEVYVGGSACIYTLSTGSFPEWRIHATLPDAPRCIALTSAFGSYLFAGSLNGRLYRSVDRGKTWTLPEGIFCSTIHSFAVDPNGGMYAATSCGLHRSTDGGITWSMVEGPLTNREVLVVAVSDGQVFAGTDGFGIFRSDDAGAAWKELYNGMENPTVRAFTATPNRFIYCGTMHGVHRSVNRGDRWDAMLAGMIATDIRSLVLDRQGHVFAATATGIFRSNDRGGSWNSINYLLTDRDVRCLALDSIGGILAGTRHGKVFRSTDDGNSWNDLNFPGRGSVETIAVHSSNTFLAGVVGEDAGIYRTFDLGREWQRFAEALAASGLAAGRGEYVYAVVSEKGIFRSTNIGSFWTSRLEIADCAPITASTSGRVFVGRTAGTLMAASLDDGLTWIGRNNVPCSGIYSLAIDAAGDVLVGTECGIFRSSNNGVTWQPDTFGMGGRATTAIGRESTRALYAGTRGWGVYLRENGSSSTGETADGSVPQRPVIAMSSPDMLNLTLHRPGRYRITLHDAVGRQLRTVADRPFEAGVSSLSLETDALPEGVYFVRLAGGEDVATLPLMVMR